MTINRKREGGAKAHLAGRWRESTSQLEKLHVRHSLYVNVEKHKNKQIHDGYSSELTCCFELRL